jgi:hypothetical protein
LLTDWRRTVPHRQHRAHEMARVPVIFLALLAMSDSLLAYPARETRRACRIDRGLGICKASLTSWRMHSSL